MKKSKSPDETSSHPVNRPLLVVLSSPSGTGKDAVLNKMKGSGYPLEYITTVTTRPRRPREKDGVDYYFVSPERFQQMLAANELLEWAEVYGNWYGVPRQPVEQALKRGRDVIIKVDVQGAATIKKAMPQAILVFLMPPSTEELTERLRQRRTETPFDLALRLKTAGEEMEQLAHFDYAVVNQRDNIEQAISEIKAIIAAEKCRVVHPG